jgi:hypothetical protein
LRSLWRSKAQRVSSRVSGQLDSEQLPAYGIFIYGAALIRGVMVYAGHRQYLEEEINRIAVTGPVTALNYAAFIMSVLVVQKGRKAFQRSYQLSSEMAAEARRTLVSDAADA